MLLLTLTIPSSFTKGLPMERVITWILLIVAVFFAINTVVCGPHALLNENGCYWLLGSQLVVVAVCIYELIKNKSNG